MTETRADHVCTVRGPAITATFHYIERAFGESSLDRIASELGAEFEDLLDIDLLLGEQADERVRVPVRLLVALMQRVADRYMPEPDGAFVLAERIGVYAAYEAQPLIRRIVINLANPHTLIRRSSRLWSHYYDCGALEAVETGEKRLRLTVRGFHAAHPVWCRRLTGYFREVLQRSSGHHARMVETQCAAKGAPLCEWLGDWSGTSLF